MKILEIIMLGVGLATDASCVCASNGLAFKPKNTLAIKMAFTYAVFQFLMPVIGFGGASLLPAAIYQHNRLIAFVLLTFIGGKMIVDGLRDSKQDDDEDEQSTACKFTNKILITQGVATSIDALSVGFAFTGMTWSQVLSASLIIALVTFIMCLVFVKIGTYIGNKINAKAELLGGAVLVFLGILHIR